LLWFIPNQVGIRQSGSVVMFRHDVVSFHFMA
jgi:hypothetical protein